MPLAPRYPVAGTTAAALLPAQAARLADREPARFALECVVAEQLLGLAGKPGQDPVSLEGEDAERARMAVALQVGMQVEQGIDAAVYEQVTAGPTTMRFRAALVHPAAARLVEDLVAPDDRFTPVSHL